MKDPTVQTLTAGATLAQSVLVLQAGTVTTAATDTPYGVTIAGANSGSPVSVKVFGVCRIAAAGAITANDALMPAASGQVQTYDGADGSVFIGHALEAAAAQGDEILCVYAPGLDASDAVTAAAVTAANTAGALREFTTITVGAESGNAITIDLAQNVAAADIWQVEVYDAAMGTLAATAAWATTETGDGALSLSHATLESHLLTLSAAGAAQLTVTDVSAAAAQSVYVKLTPLEAAQGGLAGCSYLITLTFA